MLESKTFKDFKGNKNMNQQSKVKTRLVLAYFGTKAVLAILNRSWQV